MRRMAVDASRQRGRNIRPRSNRCGVRSNVRSVSGRARGPINGRQPTVKRDANTNNANNATQPISSPFPVASSAPPKRFAMGPGQSPSQSSSRVARTLQELRLGSMAQQYTSA